MVLNDQSTMMGEMQAAADEEEGASRSVRGLFFNFFNFLKFLNGGNLLLLVYNSNSK